MAKKNVQRTFQTVDKYGVKSSFEFLTPFFFGETRNKED
jgi:hypothetical protein